MLAYVGDISFVHVYIMPHHGLNVSIRARLKGAISILYIMLNMHMGVRRPHAYDVDFFAFANLCFINVVVFINSYRIT